MVNISIDSNSVPVVKGKPCSSGSDERQLEPRKVPSVSEQRKFKLQQSESASSNAKRSDSSESEVNPQQHDISQNSTSPSIVKLKGGVRKKGNSKRVSERVLVSAQKKQKKITLSDSICQKEIKCKLSSHKVKEDTSSSRSMSPITRNSRNMESLVHASNTSDCLEAIDIVLGDAAKGSPVEDEDNDESSRKEEFVSENPCKPELMDDSSWNVIEKSLYLKGLEIFGKNRLLKLLSINTLQYHLKTGFIFFA